MKAITLWQPWATLCVLPRPFEAEPRCRWEAFPVYGDSPPVPCYTEAGAKATARDLSSTVFPWKARRRPWLPWKMIETRSWPAPKSLIGQRIAIHAAARVPTPERGPMFVGAFHIAQGGTWLHGPGVDMKLPIGAVVGTAVLAGCIPFVDNCGTNLLADEHICHAGGGLLHHRPTTAPFPEGETEHDVSDQASYGDFTPGRFGWLLADAIQLDEPIPCRGFQRVWNLPDDIAERIA